MRSRMMGRLGGEWIWRRGVEGFVDGLEQSRGWRGHGRGSGRRIGTKWDLLSVGDAHSMFEKSR